MKNRVKNKYLPLLLIIITLAFFFRFYKLQNWLFFGMDQEYEALLVKNILTFRHFPLIGVNVSDTGMYLGPAFIYFAAIPYALFGGNPVGGAFTASFLGILVTYLIYKLGREMFSERMAVLSSLFYGGSFLVSFYDRQFWNPTFIPLASLLIGYLLYKILKGENRNILWLSLVFGLAIQSHYSILVFLPLMLYVIWQKKKSFSKKLVLWAVGIFVFLQLPFLLFEIRHNFINTNALVNLLSGVKKDSQSTFFSRTSLFMSTLGRFITLPLAPDLFIESGQCNELADLRRNAYPEGIILSLSAMILLIRWIWSKISRLERLQKGAGFSSVRIVLVGIFGPTIMILFFYHRELFEYYFLYLFPWLAFMFGLSCDWILKKEKGGYIVYPILAFFIIFNLFSLFSSTFSYSYREKLEAIDFAKKYIGDKPYSLEALGECPRYGGYGYLFSIFAKPPDRSYMDGYFGWLYPQKKSQNYSTILLLSMIDPRMSEEKISSWQEEKLRILSENRVISQKSFGDISLYILEPKKYE